MVHAFAGVEIRVSGLTILTRSFQYLIGGKGTYFSISLHLEGT
jgi:hypothetical protein